MIPQGTARRAAAGSRIGSRTRGAGLGLAGPVPASLVSASLALASIAPLGMGCGGGAPLLHPAQPLPADTVSFGAGVSGQFASSGPNAAIDQGRAAASGSLDDPSTARAYAEGVLTDALLAPGVSPWVSARVGLPGAYEAGLTYTGRSLRLDGRHVFGLGGEWALSVGGGLSAVLLHPDSSVPGGEPTAPEAEFGLDATGWGGDIPLLIGYQPLDGFVDVWMGARAGFEHVSGELRSRDGDAASPRFEASGDRLWAGALAGISLGIPPIWFRFELAGTFHRLTGELTGPGAPAAGAFGELDATGWSLAPSGAILGKF